MKVLYFGTYHPDYARNAVIRKGLERNGVVVEQCYQKPGGFRAWWRLYRSYRQRSHDFDAMIVGFPGHEIMFLARVLTRKPIIFDAFTSHYGGYIQDRKKYSETSLRARYYRWVDEWSCRLADVVLLDTQAHINFFVREYGLPASRFRRVFIGADDDVFQPLPPAPVSPVLEVLFFGTFIPLQGTRYIVSAARMLQDRPIHFTLIGDGQERASVESLAQAWGLKNMVFKGKMSQEDIVNHARHAHVCLGIFGDTPKTQVVVPNKVYESLAMARAVVTADTDALREVFQGDSIIGAQAANAEDLARVLQSLEGDRGRVEAVAQRGYGAFHECASPAQIGKEVRHMIEQILYGNI